MHPWDVYFGTLCGWLLHPGYQREGAKAPSLSEIANLCDEMWDIRQERLRSWDGEQR